MLSTKMPMTQEQNQTAVLKIFAARAGAEIDRLHAWKKFEVAHGAETAG